LTRRKIPAAELDILTSEKNGASNRFGSAEGWQPERASSGHHPIAN